MSFIEKIKEEIAQLTKQYDDCKAQELQYKDDEILSNMYNSQANTAYEKLTQAGKHLGWYQHYHPERNYTHITSDEQEQHLNGTPHPYDHNNLAHLTTTKNNPPNSLHFK